MTAAEAVRAELSRAATEAAALVVLADPAEALATEAEARAMSALERRAALALAAEAVRATEVDQAEAIAAVAGSALAEAPPLIGAMTPGAAGLAAKAISWARGRMEPVLALAESAMNLPATQGPTVELELTRFLRSIGADWTAMSTIRTK